MWGRGARNLSNTYLCVCVCPTDKYTDKYVVSPPPFYFIFIFRVRLRHRPKTSTFLFRFSFYSSSSTLLFRNHVASSVCGLEPLVHAALQLLCFPASSYKYVAVPQVRCYEYVCFSAAPCTLQRRMLTYAGVY